MAQYHASDERIDRLGTGLLEGCWRWHLHKLVQSRTGFRLSFPPLGNRASDTPGLGSTFSSSAVATFAFTPCYPRWHSARIHVPSVGAAILSAAHVAEVIRSQTEALQSASESRDRVYTYFLIVALVPAVLFIIRAVRGSVLDPIAVYTIPLALTLPRKY